MAVDGDPALETLWLPFLQGHLEWPPAGGLFLQAREGWPLHQRQWPGLVCMQDYRPQVDALQRGGLTVLPAGADPASAGPWPLVLVLPPRQREQARALFARAITATAPGGRVVACMPNNEGARSGAADLARLAGPLQALSKHKCRVFWTGPLPAGVDAALVDEWALADAPRPVDVEVDGHRFLSRPGVFAWDRVDPATALLAAHLPADLSGRAADLGAGHGYLAARLLARCPGIVALDAYEAQWPALVLARSNLAPWATRASLDFHWHDVTAGLPHRYDVIVSNPPFHAQGRADRPDIGRAFIAAAAAALQPGGRLWLVANRHLPYEPVLASGFAQVRIVAQEQGFKVVEAVKA